MRPPKTFNFKPSTLNYRGFTLLELLVVMAIIAILTAMSVPAISGYLKGAKLKGGTRQVASALRQARTLAITKRKNYMVVFAISATTDAEKRYKAFKVYQVDEGTIDDWIYLPKTIVINSDNTKSTILLDTYSIPFPNDGDSTHSVARAEFKPTGGTTAIKDETIRVESSIDPKQFREITCINTTGRIEVK